MRDDVRGRSDEGVREMEREGTDEGRQGRDDEGCVVDANLGDYLDSGTQPGRTTHQGSSTDVG